MELEMMSPWGLTIGANEFNFSRVRGSEYDGMVCVSWHNGTFWEFVAFVADVTDAFKVCKAYVAQYC